MLLVLQAVIAASTSAAPSDLGAGSGPAPAFATAPFSRHSLPVVGADVAVVPCSRHGPARGIGPAVSISDATEGLSSCRGWAAAADAVQFSGCGPTAAEAMPSSCHGPAAAAGAAWGLLASAGAAPLRVAPAPPAEGTLLPTVQMLNNLAIQDEDRNCHGDFQVWQGREVGVEKVCL